MTVTVCMHEAGAVWIENAQGDSWAWTARAGGVKTTGTLSPVLL